MNGLQRTKVSELFASASAPLYTDCPSIKLNIAQSQMLSLPLFDFCRSNELPAVNLQGVTAEQGDKLRQDYGLLKKQLSELPHLAGHIYMHLSLPHSEWIADCVVLYRGLIFVIAIDQQSDTYQQHDLATAHAMARSLKEHHSASRDKFIIPVLLAPNAAPQGSAIQVSEDLVAATMSDTGEHLAALIEHFSNQYKDDEILADEWL